jgi:hypothetical protein
MLRGCSGTITVALHRGHRAAVPARSWRHRLRLVSADGPEVIKLATALIQAPLSSETARIGAAIMGHRERMGTLIIAEGIETDRHFEQAMAWPRWARDCSSATRLHCHSKSTPWRGRRPT